MCVCLAGLSYLTTMICGRRANRTPQVSESFKDTVKHPFCLLKQDLPTTTHFPTRSATMDVVGMFKACMKTHRLRPAHQQLSQLPAVGTHTHTSAVLLQKRFHKQTWKLTYIPPLEPPAAVVEDWR